MQVFVDGVETAFVRATDRGFLYGLCAFETMLAIDGVVLFLDQHLERLEESCERLGIGAWGSRESLALEVQSAAAACRGRTAIRLNITAGDGIGLRMAPKQATRVLMLRDAEAAPESIHLRTRHRSERYLPHVKRSDYVEEIVTLKHLATHEDVLWLNHRSELMECSTSNLFLLAREGEQLEIATPPEDGILAGITRKILMDLCQRAKIPVTVRSIEMSELPRFDEAFVCSSLIGIVPVAQIDQHRLHSLRPENHMRHLRRLYEAAVTQQCQMATREYSGNR